MTIQDKDGPLQKHTETITNIKWDTSSNGNKYVAIHTENNNKYWVWETSWQNELTERKQFYTGNTFHIIHTKKYAAYWPFKYLQPADKQLMDEWTKNLPEKQQNNTEKTETLKQENI